MKNRWIIALLTVFTSCGSYNDCTTLEKVEWILP